MLSSTKTKTQTPSHPYLLSSLTSQPFSTFRLSSKVSRVPLLREVKPRGDNAVLLVKLRTKLANYPVDVPWGFSHKHIDTYRWVGCTFIDSLTVNWIPESQKGHCARPIDSFLYLHRSLETMQCREEQTVREASESSEVVWNLSYKPTNTCRYTLVLSRRVQRKYREGKELLRDVNPLITCPSLQRSLEQMDKTAKQTYWEAIGAINLYPECRLTNDSEFHQNLYLCCPLLVSLSHCSFLINTNSLGSGRQTCKQMQNVKSWILGWVDDT